MSVNIPIDFNLILVILTPTFATTIHHDCTVMFIASWEEESWIIIMVTDDGIVILTCGIWVLGHSYCAHGIMAVRSMQVSVALHHTPTDDITSTLVYSLIGCIYDDTCMCSPCGHQHTFLHNHTRDCSLALAVTAPADDIFTVDISSV